jgi:hypothetical protein
MVCARRAGVLHRAPKECAGRGKWRGDLKHEIVTRVAALTAWFLLVTSPVAAGRVLAADSPLPPAAQPSYERGLAAFDRGEWSLAIRHLLEAERAASLAPQVLLHLGLAHARAGHEAAAVAWLQAYLAVAPGSHYAPRLRNEVRRLEVAVDATIHRIPDLLT